MSRLALTVGGPPGSGKTTAARTLAQLLHRQYHSAGGLFRERAEARKMTLAEFGSLALKDERIDRELDDEMIGLAVPSSLLEGRIIGELLEKRRVPVFRILIFADEKVRAGRISVRDGTSADEALAAMREREELEQRRYLSYYGIDLKNLGYELSIDSTKLTPEMVVKSVLEELPDDVRGGE